MKRFPFGCLHGRQWVVALGLGIIMVCAGAYYFASRPDRIEALNGLRDEINATYGYKQETPRINCGPCARFSLAFRERWNARFREKVNLEYVMSPDGKECRHVALKFPDGSDINVGNGVLSEQQLRMLYPKCRFDEMVEFDRKLLDERVGGLDHDYYPECTSYSNKRTVTPIEKHLAQLATDVIDP